MKIFNIDKIDIYVVQVLLKSLYSIMIIPCEMVCILLAYRYPKLPNISSIWRYTLPPKALVS